MWGFVFVRSNLETRIFCRKFFVYDVFSCIVLVLSTSYPEKRRIVSAGTKCTKENI